MKITLSNRLTLEGIPKETSKIIRDRLTFANPAYTDAVKMGRWTGGEPCRKKKLF